MPRRLKVYQTSQGFYDLVVAAPTMKAALEAWGAGSNLFQQCYARISEDKKAVSSATKKPGRVLRRPVGSDATFTEQSAVPTAAALDARMGKSKSTAPNKKSFPVSAKAVDSQPKSNRAVQKKAAVDFEPERKQRECERAARERAESRRQKAAIDKAKRALEQEQRMHGEIMAKIGEDHASVERREEVETNRWDKVSTLLQDGVRKARG